LERASRHGIRISFEHGETVFYCGQEKVRRQIVLRLWQLRHLIDADDGLFPNCSQTLLVNVTGGDDIYAHH
jgi:hypothetical protein